MSALMGGQSRVPPGFRFHPTDEELVGYYLTKKVASKKIDLDVIHDIDLYKLEPWDLNERCRIGSAEQTEWYFFSHKDKKYPTGTRTNRATAAGFWKATGRDKAIHTKFKLIGMRKTLVFYKGRAPNGQKTDWIMHEYRLEDESNNGNDDGWVVCRVFKKRNTHRNQEREVGSIYGDQIPLPELDSPTKAIIGDHSYTQSMICKQEIEVDDGYGNTHDPFSQLPQLESPKISGNPPPTMKGYYSGNPARNDHPSHFCLDAASFGTKSVYTERLTHFNNEPVTDWRMVDRLAAAQLSHEEALKDIRYSSGNSDPMGDVALLLRLSKQHPSDYSSSDIDLWSFGR